MQTSSFFGWIITLLGIIVGVAIVLLAIRNDGLATDEVIRATIVGGIIALAWVFLRWRYPGDRNSR